MAERQLEVWKHKKNQPGPRGRVRPEWEMARGGGAESPSPSPSLLCIHPLGGSPRAGRASFRIAPAPPQARELLDGLSGLVSFRPAPLSPPFRWHSSSSAFLLAGSGPGQVQLPRRRLRFAGPSSEHSQGTSPTFPLGPPPGGAGRGGVQGARGRAISGAPPHPFPLPQGAATRRRVGRDSAAGSSVRVSQTLLPERGGARRGLAHGSRRRRRRHGDLGRCREPAALPAGVRVRAVLGQPQLPELPGPERVLQG